MRFCPECSQEGEYQGVADTRPLPDMRFYVQVISHWYQCPEGHRWKVYENE